MIFLPIFVFSDKETYENYYNIPHQHEDLLKGRFVYGLPEIYRDEIAKADAVANPGCFALLVQLMLLPFKDKMKSADVIAISGTSGGGRARATLSITPIVAKHQKLSD